MVASKKKLRQQTNHIKDADMPNKASKFDKEAVAAPKFTDDQLFSTNVGGNVPLKAKREKLKENRFKEIENSRKSKVDELLIKRLQDKMNRKEAAGLDPLPQKKRKVTEDDDLEDLWATAAPVISQNFNRYKTDFARKDHLKVKAVINPTGGQSYNPAVKDHKVLLRGVAKKEEELVEKDLKDLQKIRPM